MSIHIEHNNLKNYLGNLNTTKFCIIALSNIRNLLLAFIIFSILKFDLNISDCNICICVLSNDINAIYRLYT